MEQPKAGYTTSSPGPRGAACADRQVVGIRSQDVKSNTPSPSAAVSRVVCARNCTGQSPDIFFHYVACERSPRSQTAGHYPVLIASKCTPHATFADQVAILHIFRYSRAHLRRVSNGKAIASHTSQNHMITPIVTILRQGYREKAYHPPTNRM